MTTDQRLKTGTTTMGIVCKDGIVVLADKRISMGGSLVVGKLQKLHIINERFVTTISGVVSDAQLLSRHIRSEIRLKGLQSGNPVMVREAAHLLSNFTYSHLRSAGGIASFLFGGMDSEGYHLYNVSADGAIQEEKAYTATGSGSYFALSVLDADYHADITVKEGIELAKKALSSSIARDTASGDGYDMAIITKDGAELLEPVVFEKPM